MQKSSRYTIPDIHKVIQFGSNKLSKLVNNCSNISKYNNLILPYLESRLQSVCFIMGISKDTITIATPSSAHTMRLRYQIPLIQKRISTDPYLKHIKNIYCKTWLNFNSKVNNMKHKNNNPLKSYNGHIALKKLSTVVKDNKLKEALEKLSANLY